MTPEIAGLADAPRILELREAAAAWLVSLGIRQWSPGEVALATIEEQVRRGEWWVTPHAALRVLDEDPTIWGPSTETALYVHGLVIARDQVGKGAGAALLRWVSERAASLGKALVRLDCVESNPRLRQHYRDLGFREVGRHAFSDPRWHPAVLLEKPVLNLRAASRSDHAAIVRLHTQGDLLTVYAGREAPPLHHEKSHLWSQLLDSPPPGQQVTVAVLCDEVVGFTSAGQDLEDPSRGKVYALFVDPQHWGRGIGSALLRESERHLGAVGMLWVVRTNDRARGLYERRGWSPTSDTKVAMGTDWVLLEKRIVRRQYHLRPGPDGLQAWDLDRLLALTAGLPVESVPLSAIAELDTDWWYAYGSEPTIRSVADHARLVDETDLAHPIIIDPDGGVMDGMHRVVKALLEGQETISAKRLTTLPAPDHVGVDPADLPYE